MKEAEEAMGKWRGGWHQRFVRLWVVADLLCKYYGYLERERNCAGGSTTTKIWTMAKNAKATNPQMAM
jgi:hypothetical protein